MRWRICFMICSTSTDSERIVKSLIANILLRASARQTRGFLDGRTEDAQ
jgi:hypothetical protein